MLKRSDLHNYQVAAVQFIKDNDGAGLFLGLGAGKTGSTLTAMQDIYDDFEVDRFLVIGPKFVAQTVWHNEATEWEHIDLDFAICTGPKKNRLEALSKNATVTVINRENIPWLVEHYKSKWPFKMIIVDESSSFKNPTAKRFRALKSIRKYIDRCVILTATPSPNGYLDLWSQIFLLDGGGRLGFNITSYRNTYFNADFMGYNYTLKAGAMHKIQSKIQDLIISANYEDLPNYVSTVMNSPLEGKLRKQYAKFEEDAILNTEEVEVSAVNAAVLTGKLMQFSSGAIYDDEDRSVIHHFHDLKFDMLDEILELNPNENIIVVYNFKHELSRLEKRYPHGRTIAKDGSTIKEWNEGKVKMLFVHPACLGGDTEVLTEHRGWVKITDVNVNDRVYDGVEYVSHRGCIYSGYKEVIDVAGMTMTPDHKLLIDNKWTKAKDVKDAESFRRESDSQREAVETMRGAVRELWDGKGNATTKCNETQSQGRETLHRVQEDSRDDRHKVLQNMETHERPLHKNIFYGLQKLWRSWNKIGREVVNLREFHGRHVGGLFRHFTDRQDRRKWRLHERELSMGNNKLHPTDEQAEQQVLHVERGENNFRGVGKKNRCNTHNDNASGGQKRNDGGRRNIRCEDVYDLVDCGPRNRFIIRNSEGQVFISHNSAGHGIQLQHGGHIMVMLGFTWSLELYKQVIGRIHRQGQKNNVRVIHLAVGAVEHKLMRTISRKDITQEDLLKALR